MHISDKDIRAGEVIFKTDCGNYDSKHILNLADREVPAELLRRIEDGCPIEAIDEIAKDFPICKYRTQITVHGKFPEVRTHYIGEYHNLVRNQNGSVGIRWDAIDNAKKEKLFYTVRKLRGWSVCHNSTTFCLRQMKFVNDGNKAEVLAAMKAEAERIDNGRGLFFGGASVCLCSVPFFGLVAVLQVNVNAYYEENYQAVLELVSGMTGAEIEAKLAEYEEAKKREAEERDRRLAEYKAKQDEEKAKLEAENAKWLGEHPSPFPMEKGHTLVPGEIICKPMWADGYGKPHKYERWAYYVIGKAFGKTTETPCDENGNKERFTRGREVKALVGDFYVKPVARRVEIRKPVASPSVSADAVATACTVTENYAKGGLEIRFNAKPSASVIAQLKANGWRWSRFGGCWWIRKSDAAVDFANRIGGKLAA